MANAVSNGSAGASNDGLCDFSADATTRAETLIVVE
jgi:hypothetical protein